MIWFSLTLFPSACLGVVRLAESLSKWHRNGGRRIFSQRFRSRPERIQLCRLEAFIFGQAGNKISRVWSSPWNPADSQYSFRKSSIAQLQPTESLSPRAGAWRSPDVLDLSIFTALLGKRRPPANIKIHDALLLATNRSRSVGAKADGIVLNCSRGARRRGARLSTGGRKAPPRPRCLLSHTLPPRSAIVTGCGFSIHQPYDLVCFFF